MTGRPCSAQEPHAVAGSKLTRLSEMPTSTVTLSEPDAGGATGRSVLALIHPSIGGESTSSDGLASAAAASRCGLRRLFFDAIAMRHVR